MATRTCRICGRTCAARQWRHGRCPRCAIHWHRHGVERPPDLHTPRPCQTCGQLSQALRRGRCHTCYAYWHRTGRERPPRLWQRQ